MAGAPLGNTNGTKKHRMLSDALKRELTQNPEEVRKIARKLIDAAMEGQPWAMSLIHDRVDGKAPQPIVGDDDEDPLRMISKIERVLVRANTEG